MRIVFIALCLVCFGTFTSAPARAGDKSVDKSGYSTGHQQTPETTGQKQPQGWTAPLEIRSGGASPGESARSESTRNRPPNSSKTMVEPDKSK
jgi:hypothetical protein